MSDMARSMYGTVKVEIKEGRCFYHASGDSIEYYDLESLVMKHPELKSFVENFHVELQREYFRQKELLENR